MRLSIITPSIRVEHIERLHKSIESSFSGKWEHIVIGPYKPDFTSENMTWIFSKASPIVCQQMALLESKGDYICFAWDDGWYLPEAIDDMFRQLDAETNTYRDSLSKQDVAISGKYIEGDIAPEYMKSHKYYIINTHDAASSPYIDNNFLILCTGLISRETLLAIGGFDCRFEATGVGAVDLAIRLQLYGTKILLSENIVLECTWLPGKDGDHGPICEAYDDDIALLHKKYRQPIFHKRVVVPLDNWKQQPSVWSKRFKDES